MTDPSAPHPSFVRQATRQSGFAAGSGRPSGTGTLIAIAGVLLSVLIGLGRGAARNNREMARGPGGMAGKIERLKREQRQIDELRGLRKPDEGSHKDVAAKPLLSQWFEIRLECRNSVREYSGSPGEELSLVRDTSDTVLELSMAGRVFERSREVGELPGAGECDQCRIQFGIDGRPFISLHQRWVIEGDPQPLDFRGTYYLKVVEGTQAIYESGEPITLVFTDQGLRQLKEDCAKYFTEHVARCYTEVVDNPPAGRPSKRTPRVACEITEFPASHIIATRSTCVIEDRQPLIARLTVCLPPEPEHSAGAPGK
jgi:hypothetical protein